MPTFYFIDFVAARNRLVCSYKRQYKLNKVSRLNLKEVSVSGVKEAVNHIIRKLQVISEECQNNEKQGEFQSRGFLKTGISKECHLRHQTIFDQYTA